MNNTILHMSQIPLPLLESVLIYSSVHLIKNKISSITLHSVGLQICVSVLKDITAKIEPLYFQCNVLKTI